jgi:hypothetical protein
MAAACDAGAEMSEADSRARIPASVIAVVRMRIGSG